MLSPLPPDQWDYLKAAHLLNRAGFGGTPANVDSLVQSGMAASIRYLVAGPANATINIAAACGTPSWFVCPPGGWPMLGTGRYPWYPRARVFSPPGFNRWAPVMAELAAALRQDASPTA